MSDLGTLGVISLEPWDDVWRRNQHFAHQLMVQRRADRIVFVEPPQPAPAISREVEPGITAVRPRLLMPRRAGGLGATAATLQLREIKGVDLVWINDATLGRHLVGKRAPAVYDVTDDWRSSSQHPRVRRRQIAAENILALRAATVVCSETLRQLWQDRYDLEATVVVNGADVAAIGSARPRALPGPAPHAVYVGTLHRDRLDLDVLMSVAARVGTLHLVGPDSLDDAAHEQLKRAPNIEIHGPVTSHDVPGWLVSADVLICPHIVSPFTLSLDAIKAHEYLATDRPIVATPTSGFAAAAGHEGVTVVDVADFPAAVAAAAGRSRRPVEVPTWAGQAALFADRLSAAIEAHR